MSPSSLATNMDTESFLDGATVLSNSVQTALMNVSHFILGIRFCAANGHNYVAKLRGAINKTELSTKSCRKRQAESLAIASLWKKGCQESHGKKRWDGERPSWALWAGSARRSWGNSSCHPCRNVMGHLQGLQLHVHSQPTGFPLVSVHRFYQEILQVVEFCLPHHKGLVSMLWDILEVAEAFRNSNAVCWFICFT